MGVLVWFKLKISPNSARKNYFLATTFLLILRAFSIIYSGFDKLLLISLSLYVREYS